MGLRLSQAVTSSTFKMNEGTEQGPQEEEKVRSLLRYRVDRLCFRCHTSLDLSARAELKDAWVHGPFQAGVCLGCHDPHQSENPRLLVAYPWSALCSRCHPGFHGGKEESAHPGAECRSCHSPHYRRRR